MKLTRASVRGEPGVKPPMTHLGQSHHSLVADWAAGLAVPPVLQLDYPVLEAVLETRSRR
jgi:hypothetical protein